MEESELDEWFSEQREKLEEAFFTAVNGTTNTEKACATFDHAYRKLIADFQKKQEQLYEGKIRAAKRKEPFLKYQELLQLRIKAIGAWFKDQEQRLKKWRFDRKIKKILEDKSDLY